jgi:hypothetical protein
MFATCLPREIVLRVWDSLLLEGSEILLKTGLAIWGKLSRYKYTMYSETCLLPPKYDLSRQVVSQKS